MNMFLAVDNIIPCFYLFSPQIAQFQMFQKQNDVIKTQPSLDAEILKPNIQQRKMISLTKEDLQLKGYDNNKKSWSQAQDKQLLRLCQDQNARFQQIAQLIPGRNAKMCYSRYRRLTNQVKQSWSQRQNTLLRRLVSQLGEDWKRISPFFKRRNDKQLKDHYINYLRPNLNTGEWSIEEDLKLIELINIYGKDWKNIEEKMQDRSRNQIKNRYFGRIKRIDEEKKKRQQQAC